MSRTADIATIDRIASRYPTPSHRSYVRGKLRWDPLFGAVAPLLSASPHALLDIGCGLGLLGQVMRERGFTQRYVGIDVDAKKIDEAREAAANGGFDLVFETAHANALPDIAGNVALLDVLHYMPAEAQREVLDDAAARVAPGALVLIRNVVRDDTWRFRATVLQERLSHGLGWMRCETGHFPTEDEIAGPLRAAGLDVEVKPLWGRTPFNSWLFVARRE